MWAALRRPSTEICCIAQTCHTMKRSQVDEVTIGGQRSWPDPQVARRQSAGFGFEGESGLDEAVGVGPVRR